MVSVISGHCNNYLFWCSSLQEDMLGEDIGGRCMLAMHIGYAKEVFFWKKGCCMLATHTGYVKEV